jgi:hypothetical protein
VSRYIRLISASLVLMSRGYVYGNGCLFRNSVTRIFQYYAFGSGKTYVSREFTI